MMGENNRVWAEVTCLDDTERVFVTNDDGPFERRTEPFGPVNDAPWTAADFAAMHAHLRKLRIY